MLGKIEGRRRKGQQKMRWLDGMSLSKLQEVKDREAWCAVVHGVEELDTPERLSNNDIKASQSPPLFARLTDLLKELNHLPQDCSKDCFLKVLFSLCFL